MTARILLLLACTLFGMVPARGAETVWTAIIANGFPGDVFTWRLNPDGRYREDGRDAATNAPIQPTLSGRWTVSGTHMRLQQEGINYIFEGEITADAYQGILYLDGKVFSRFCALKGREPPPNCDISV